MRAIASVQTGPRQLEVQELDVPVELGHGDVLLEVEGCGICGTDLEQYVGELQRNPQYPRILGHEPVGRIARIGVETSHAWSVKEGDRVAVEPHAPCRICRPCLEGCYSSCSNQFTYGLQSTSRAHGLWGGMSQYMVLLPTTKVYKVPAHLSIEDAVLFNPMGAGFEWVCRRAGAVAGDTVLIMSPGQRGLACVVAAREVGASDIIVTGLSRDSAKLELARELGATRVVNVEEEDVVSVVREVTGGRGADRVIDVTPFVTQPIVDAMRAVRVGGTVVLAGLKGGMKEVAGFVSDRIVFKEITMRGVLGVGSWAYDQAIRTISAHKYPLQKMHTHTLGIHQLDLGMRLLAGEVAGERALHITIVPK